MMNDRTLASKVVMPTLTTECPECHYDLTNILIGLATSTHPYGAVVFCPGCNNPKGWIFDWGQYLKGIHTLKEQNGKPDAKLLNGIAPDGSILNATK